MNIGKYHPYVEVKGYKEPKTAVCSESRGRSGHGSSKCG